MGGEIWLNVEWSFDLRIDIRFKSRNGLTPALLKGFGWITVMKAQCVTCLEIHPGVQLPVAVELAQQTRVCDAVRAAGHRAAATRQTTELTVLVLPEQPWATNQRHCAVHLQDNNISKCVHVFCAPFGSKTKTQAQKEVGKQRKWANKGSCIKHFDSYQHTWSSKVVKRTELWH